MTANKAMVLLYVACPSTRRWARGSSLHLVASLLRSFSSLGVLVVFGVLAWAHRAWQRKQKAREEARRRALEESYY